MQDAKIPLLIAVIVGIGFAQVTNSWNVALILTRANINILYAARLGLVLKISQHGSLNYTSDYCERAG